MAFKNPKYLVATPKYLLKNYFIYFSYTYILYQYKLLGLCFARRLKALDLKAQDLGEKAKARETIAKIRNLLIVPHEKSLLILLNSC